MTPEGSRGDREGIGPEEITSRARGFSARHRDDSYEMGESQTFLNDLFRVFGRDRRDAGARFEEHVGGAGRGRMDLIWPGVLLVEMKSACKGVGEAMDDALGYCRGLPPGRSPRYVLGCNFREFRLRDMLDGRDHAFGLSELADNIGLFGFMAGDADGEAPAAARPPAGTAGRPAEPAAGRMDAGIGPAAGRMAGLTSGTEAAGAGSLEHVRVVTPVMKQKGKPYAISNIPVEICKELGIDGNSRLVWGVIGGTDTMVVRVLRGQAGDGTVRHRMNESRGKGRPGRT